MTHTLDDDGIGLGREERYHPIVTHPHSVVVTVLQPAKSSMWIGGDRLQLRENPLGDRPIEGFDVPQGLDGPFDLPSVHSRPRRFLRSSCEMGRPAMTSSRA